MKFINPEFVRYVAVGIGNTLLTYILFIIGVRLMPYQWAYTLVYILGIVTSYVLQSLLVFRQPLNWRKAIQYPAVYVIQYFLGLLFLAILVELLHIPPEIASLVNLMLTIPITFLLSKKIINPKTKSNLAYEAHSQPKSDA
jgi:putative flippase GtrA